MNSEDFISKCKQLVFEYAWVRMDRTYLKQSSSFKLDDVYVVWSVKVLQNSKALLSTNVPDGMYYEITYNGDKGEIYLDAYKKFENIKYDV